MATAVVLARCSAPQRESAIGDSDTVGAQAPDGYPPPKRARHDRSPSTGPA